MVRPNKSLFCVDARRNYSTCHIGSMSADVICQFTWHHSVLLVHVDSSRLLLAARAAISSAGPFVSPTLCPAYLLENCGLCHNKNVKAVQL